MNTKQRKELRPLLDAIRAAAQAIADAREGVESIRDAEQDKHDNMPEGLQGGERGEKLQTIIDALSELVDFDTDALTDACDTVEGEL